MKKALIVAPAIPYPIDGGNKVALHGYVVALRAAGYDYLTIICYGEGVLQDSGGIDKVIRVKKPGKFRLSMLWAFLRGRSILMARFYSRLMADAIEAELAAGGYSAVLSQHAYIAQHLCRVDKRVLLGVRTVVSSEVLESRAYLQKSRLARGVKAWLLRREAEVLDSEETEYISGFDCVTFFSDEDRAHYLFHGGAAAGAEVINLGLDLSRYRRLPRRSPDGVSRLCFFGSFSWFANSDALEFLLRDVWPALLAKVQNIELHIAGRDIPDWVKSAGGDDVVIHGRVPSIEGFLAEMDVVLSPIRIGGGVRLKMLEAMAMGRPVVSTVAGVEGLEPGLIKLINVASSVEEFVHLVERLVVAKPGLSDADSVDMVRRQYDARSLARLF